MSEKSKKTAIEMRTEFLAQIISDLENNTAPWRNGMKKTGRAINAATGKAYSGINMLSLSYYNPLNQIDNRWMTYKQAQNKGYQVRKGEKGATVFFYREYDKNTKKDFDRKKIEHLSKDERKAYEEKNVAHIITKTSVFNGSQIDGMPPLETTRSVDINEFQKTLIKNSQAPIEFINTKENFYSPGKDIISIANINLWESSEALTSTIMHEIMHSTGYESRLGRDIKNTFGTPNYAREELVAEMGTVLALNENGFATDPSVFDNNKAYIKSWISMLKDKPALIVDIIKDAEKAFSYTQENIIEKELTKETIMADEKVKKIEDLKIGDLVIGDEKWGKVKQNSKTNEMYYAYRGGVRDGSIDAYVGLKIENLIEVSDFEKELAVEEPEKWNLVNDKKRQEFYNKIGIDPTEPLFAGGKSLQDITIEVNEPVYEPEDYNTPDRKLTLSADDVLADAFMSYEKYEEGMPFPGWYQYEKDIPLAEIKNIDDFLSEKNFAFNYDHNIDVRKIFNLARDSREAFLKEKEIEKPTRISFYGKKEWHNKKGKLHRENDLPAVEYADGKKEWYKDGKLHRDNDLPAVEHADGKKEWYKNGKQHRDGDKPAIEWAEGTKLWFKNGELHRDNDLPAAERANGNKEWWINGKLHRNNDLPAIEWANGNKQWFINGELHRDNDKPAWEFASGYKEWYINGKLHRDGDKPAVEWSNGDKDWYKNGKQYQYNDQAKENNSLEKENVKNLFSSLTGPYDPSTGEKFTGKNAEKALLVMQQRNSKDPRFLEYPAIDEYGLSLKDNLKEKLVLIEKGKERIFFNAIDINGIPPYKEKRIEIKKKQISSQGYEL